jgi:hypothetical protein
MRRLTDDIQSFSLIVELRNFLALRSDFSQING